MWPRYEICYLHIDVRTSVKNSYWQNLLYVFLWTTKIGGAFDCFVLSAKYMVLSISYLKVLIFFLCAFGMFYTIKMWIIVVHIWNVIFWIDMPLWKESIHLKLTCSLVANCDRCWTKDHIWINKYNNRVQFSIAWEWWLPWRPYCLTGGVAPCGGFHLGKYQFELSVL